MLVIQNYQRKIVRKSCGLIEEEERREDPQVMIINIYMYIVCT